MSDVGMLVGNAESLSPADNVIAAVIAGEGHAFKPFTAGASGVVQWANSMSAVVVTASANATTVGTSVKGVTKPLIVLSDSNPAAWFNNGMSGPTTGASNGTWRILTAAAGHPMIAGFTAGATVSAWNSTGPNRFASDPIGTALAYHGTATDVVRATWFVAEKGAALRGGGTAAGMRIGLSGHETPVATLSAPAARWREMLVNSLRYALATGGGEPPVIPPTVSIATPGAALVGVPKQLTAAVTGEGVTVAWTLPAGVTGTGLTTLTPTVTATAVGVTAPIRVTATNAGGTASASVTLTVTTPTQEGEPYLLRTPAGIIPLLTKITRVETGWFDYLSGEVFTESLPERFGLAQPDEPVSVTASADQTINELDTATVTATGAGGTGAAYTYTWTKVSGPDGTFSGSGATRTFTPTGGEGTYVLGVTASDGSTTSPQDTVTLTVTDAGALKWGLPSDWSPTNVTATNSMTFNTPGDYNVVFPDGAPLAGRFQIDVPASAPAGIRIAIIGGQVTTTGTQTEPVFFNCQGVEFLHVEGLRLSGGDNRDGIRGDFRRFGSVVQIQNVKIDRLYGTEAGDHADVIQIWSGPATLRIDRLHGISNYQGLVLHPRQFGPWLANPTELDPWDISNVWIESVEDLGTPFYSWHDLATGLPEINAEDLYVTVGSGHSPAPSIATTGGGAARVPDPWAGTYTVGVTPPGGTVLIGNPGSSYVSPGYEPSAGFGSGPFGTSPFGG